MVDIRTWSRRGTLGEGRMRRWVGLVVLLGSLWAVPVGAGAARSTASGSGPRFDGVVREEAVIANRWGDPMKAYLVFPAVHGQKAAGRFPVVLNLSYFPAPTWEEKTGQFFQPGWDMAGFNLARDFDWFA